MIFLIKVNMNNTFKTLIVDCKQINNISGRAEGETANEYDKPNLVQCVGGLPPGQAEERWHLSG